MHDLGEQYLLAVPHNITVRILDGDQLPQRGSQPKPGPFTQLKTIWDGLPPEAWTRIDVRDGEKGPLVVELAVVPRVQAKIAKLHTPYAETAVFIRYTDAHGTRHGDYYLSDAAPDTLPAEFARVASAERRVEAFAAPSAKRGWTTTKYELGAAGIIIKHSRSSPRGSWYRKRGGKKTDAGFDCSPSASDHRNGIAADMESNQTFLDYQPRQGERISACAF